MNTLKLISLDNVRVPKEYRQSKSLDEIKKDLDSLDFSKVVNPHIINLKALLYPINKTVVKLEFVKDKHTMDLEVEDESHSYKANGVSVHNTVNLPSEYPYEDFKKLYVSLYETGVIKGGTTYRAGTMTEVLASVTPKSAPPESRVLRINKNDAPKRPESLPCDIHQITADGEKWLVFVGLLEGDPYEVFAFKPKTIHIPSKIKTGALTKVKKGQYNLELNEIVIDDVKSHFETNEQEALTRMISTSLRHGADTEFIVDQLSKSEGTIVSFSKAIARALKKYIKETKLSKQCEVCSSYNVALQEGCFICMDCSESKCS